MERETVEIEVYIAINEDGDVGVSHADPKNAIEAYQEDIGDDEQNLDVHKITVTVPVARPRDEVVSKASVTIADDATPVQSVQAKS